MKYTTLPHPRANVVTDNIGETFQEITDGHHFFEANTSSYREMDRKQKVIH